MAKQHGHQLRPAREAFGPLLGLMLAHQSIEFIPRNLPEQLTEQTRLPYHHAEALLLYPVCRVVLLSQYNMQHISEGFNSTSQTLSWTTVIPINNFYQVDVG
jgi:hypothetical protein